MRFNKNECCDMLETFIECRKRCSVAVRTYHQNYPERRVPSKSCFVKLYRRFRISGSVNIPKRRSHNRIVNNERVINYFENHIKNSQRDGVRDLNLSKSTIQRRLKKNGMKAYSVKPVHKLYEADHEKRVRFCRRILAGYEMDSDFLKKILWTDEANFTTCGMYNRKNTHVYARQNPHEFEEISRSGRTSVGVWCGILKNKVIGPIFYNGALNGARYMNWLENEIEIHLEDIPLNDYMNIIWQQDGAPVHNTLRVTEFLNERYDTWIGKNGTIAWPPRCPDLTPLDFFLWGYLKNRVYKNRSRNIDEIKQKIREEINLLNTKPEIFSRLQRHIRKRYRMCINQNGNHIEQLL